MTIKIIVIIIMIIILFSLGSSMFFLLRDSGKTNNVVKALTWRIGLSLTLFIIILLAFSFGWLKPHMI